MFDTREKLFKLQLFTVWRVSSFCCDKMAFKNLILGLLAWCFIPIILAVPLVIIVLWKLTVILIAKVVRRDLLVLASGDAMNAPGDSSVHSVMNFALISRIDGIINLEDLQLKFSQLFLGRDPDTGKLQYERLHSAIVVFGGFTFFKLIDRIDINDHIYIKGLREQQCLEDMISEWLLAKYKENFPCWEIMVVQDEDKNETVMALKIHHALADGYSLLHIWDKLTENESPYLVKDFAESFGQEVSQMLQAPSHLGKMTGDGETKNPFAIPKNSPYKWTIGFARLDLKLLKTIRRKHEVHFAPVMLSLIGGALRRYLLEKGGQEGLPEYILMGITLPWPRHPAKTSGTPTNKMLCNHWVAGIVKIPIAENIDPLQRLKEVNRNLEDFQSAGLHKFLKRVLLRILGSLPAPIFQQMSANDPRVAGGYSSTVGGNGYKLLGKEVKSIHEVLAVHDVNPFLSISTFAFSHSNHLDFTFAANPQHFSCREDLDRILHQYMPHELRRLEFLSGILENEAPVANRVNMD